MSKIFDKALLKALKTQIGMIPDATALTRLKLAVSHRPLWQYFPIWLKQTDLYVNPHLTQICQFVLEKTMDGQWITPKQIGAKFSSANRPPLRDGFRNHPELQILIVADDTRRGHYHFNPEKLREFLAAFEHYQNRADPQPLLDYLQACLKARGLYVNRRIFCVSELLFKNSLAGCWTSPGEIAQRLPEKIESEIDYLVHRDPRLRPLITYNRSHRQYSLTPELKSRISDEVPDHKQTEILQGFWKNYLQPQYRKWRADEKDSWAELRKDIILTVIKAALAGQGLTRRELATALQPRPKSYWIRDNQRNHPELNIIMEKDARKQGRYWFKQTLLEEIQADFQQKSLS